MLNINGPAAWNPNAAISAVKPLHETLHGTLTLRMRGIGNTVLPGNITADVMLLLDSPLLQ
jgi:hypothetical protein